MKKSVWHHFAILFGIAIVILVARWVSHLHESASHFELTTILWAALLAVPGELSPLLALLPAIAIATGRLGPRAVRQALAMLAVIMMAMVAFDLWVVPATNLAQQRSAARSPTRWPTPADSAPLRRPIDSVGTLRTAARLLAERPPAMHELLRSYSPSHPRMVAADVVERLAFFALPFITMGLVLGISAWLGARVIFRAPRDEVVARWFLAWVLAPVAWVLIPTWSAQSNYRILFLGKSLWLPLVPYLPFLVLAALGWRAAHRAADQSAWVPSAERDGAAPELSAPAV